MKRKTSTLIIFTSLFYVLLSIALLFVLLRGGNYPNGENSMFYMYRADTLLKSIKEGHFFLYYDPSLYNGVELLRYFGVISTYFLAGVEWLAGGDAVNGYLIATCLIFFLAAEEVFIIGVYQGRGMASSFIGAIWFFFPMNLYLWFSEGNLPGAMAVMLLVPLVYLFMKQFIRTGSVKNGIGVVISMFVLCLTEETFAIMFLFLGVLWLCVLKFMGKANNRVLATLGLLVSGMGLSAFWFIPAMSGNVHYGVETEALQQFFQSLTVTLNPLERWMSSNAHWYIGLATVLLAVFMLINNKGDSRASAVVYLLVVVLSSTFFYTIIRHIYGSSLLKMLQMCSVASAMLIVDFLAWVTLRRSITAVSVILLVLDSLPSLSLIYGQWSGLSDDKRFSEESDYTWITSAGDITENRIALMDNSTLSSTGTWLVSGEEKMNGVFGSGWTSSSTQDNTRLLNQALQQGNYLYMFDRLLSYGADSVIVKTNQLKSDDKEELEQMDECANKVGYSLVKKNQDYRFYSYSETGTFGTESTYSYLAIGSDAGNICISYPAFQLADSSNLSEYSFDELKKYKVIYLSGFTYDDKDEAENLVKQLSENGTRIIISADGIPENTATHHQNFLGVECQPIQFKYGFPELHTIEGTLQTDLFPSDYTTWQTVYVNGLKEVYGSVNADNKTLPFYGTAENENILVIGFRMTQFYGLTKDANVEKLLNHSMNVSWQDLPDRKIKTLDIEKTGTTITINGVGENIDTNIAYAPCMKIEGAYTLSNHMIVMKGNTLTICFGISKIQIIGWIVSLISLLYVIYFVRRKNGLGR